MKVIVATIAAIGIGFSVQFGLRPSVTDAELQATAAWNAGNAVDAERLARRILARQPGSERARSILEQVAYHSGSPELRIAIAELKTSELSPGNRLAELGTVAMSQNLLRLAEHYWADGLVVDASNQRLHRSLVTLAALQLDSDRMQRSLLAWCAHGTPTAELILLYLASGAIDDRDAATAESTLRSSLQADSTDKRSRYALAQCLIALGRQRECELILSDAADPIQATFLALSNSVAGDEISAARGLPEVPPLSFAADYYFASGLIALQQDRLSDAVTGLGEAVRCRPLNRTFRTRYCEALRRSGDTAIERTQLESLEALFEIVEIAKGSETQLDKTTTQRLIRLCEDIGAADAVRILSHYMVL